MIGIYLFIGVIAVLLMFYYADGKLAIEKEDIGLFIVMVLFWPCILMMLIIDYLYGGI